MYQNICRTLLKMFRVLCSMEDDSIFLDIMHLNSYRRFIYLFIHFLQMLLIVI